MSGSWGSLDAGDLWESKVSLEVLSSGFSQNVIWMLNDSLDDVDRVSSGGVSTGHLGVHL